MKQMFSSLHSLADRLAADAALKADFVLPTSQVSMNDDATISTPAFEPTPATNIAHGQIATTLDIPRAYYDRMRDADPALLARNVNGWISRRDPGERRMVRTNGTNVRAMLSDRYQRIDNYEVADVTLAQLERVPGLRVISSAVTESRLYIKAVSTDLVLPVKGSRRVGDMVEAGVMIRNSEVGQGSVSIQPFAHFLVCTNGMVREKGQLRAAHVGRRIDASIEGLLSEGTKRMEDEVVLRKVRDVIANAFDAVSFRAFIDSLSATTEQQIGGDVNAAVEALGPTLGLSVGERQSVLRHLITGGDLSRYGLTNAVTRTAEDVESYDRATEIETLGYRLVDLPTREWQAIAYAKPLALTA